MSEKLCDYSDVKLVRTKLFSHLEDVLGFAEQKMDRPTVAESTKLACARIRISAVEAWGKLLSDVQLEQISERLEKLEARR